MTRRVRHVLVDDLEGGPADETVRFGLDGVAYEIDLSAGNAERLRTTLRRWASRASAEPAGAAAPGPGEAGQARELGQGTAVIRRWAERNGYRVSARGRIPVHVQDAYRRAHTLRTRGSAVPISPVARTEAFGAGRG